MTWDRKWTRWDRKWQPGVAIPGLGELFKSTWQPALSKGIVQQKSENGTHFHILRYFYSNMMFFSPEDPFLKQYLLTTFLENLFQSTKKQKMIFKYFPIYNSLLFFSLLTYTFALKEYIFRKSGLWRLKQNFRVLAQTSIWGNHLIHHAQYILHEW